ncbi:Amino acid transporter, transmembrane [Cynara cardunculus var. scolymus]|uniref:Amino acid transporter, transmembrane n=1 Tax=Cynara cardunculus var. scolymus TaxID=59895 RepID=A0A118JF39_CYNCS|nr:Amino acid transporter, transmembrane [Cynara cardunculus var. scolymus]
MRNGLSSSLSVTERGYLPSEKFDDDGRIKRTGTYMSATAHIITAVIGSGVLSLAWCFAQLGWIAGSITLVLFSVITMFNSILLTDCYRSPDPVTGTRNYTYMDAVKSNLGTLQYKLCGVAQYGVLTGITIGYTTTTAISMATGNGIGKTSLTGVPVGKDFSGMEKMWKTFSALGDVAFAYSFCFDTLKSSPPENKQMKKATATGIMASTVFYMLCGVLGYAAFGNDAPGNFLTGFGFYDPFWLIDIANICIVIHLLGAYQVLAQPLFGFVESSARKKWPQNKLVTKELSLCGIDINMFRLVWRTTYVIVTTIIAMIFPFFNDFVGLLGAGTFWPLSVYFPIEMYISQAKIPKYSFRWIWMQILSLACLIVSLVAAVGSTRGLITSVQSFKPFESVS